MKIAATVALICTLSASPEQMDAAIDAARAYPKGDNP